MKRWREVESYYHNYLNRDLDPTRPNEMADRQYWANQFLFAAAKEADINTRRTRFEGALKTMKELAEKP